MIRKRIYRDGMVMSGCGSGNNYANRSNRSGVMMPQSWLAYLVRYRLGIAAVMGCFCACSIAMNAFLFWRVQLNYQVPVLTDGSGVRGSDGAAGIVSSLWYMHQLGQNHPHSISGNNDHHPFTSRHGVDGDKNSELDPYMQALQTELKLLNEQRQLHDQQQQQNTAEHQRNVQGAGAIAEQQQQQQQQQQLPPPRPLGHLPHGAVKADHSHMVEPVDEVEKLVIQNRIHEFGEQVISSDGHGAQPQEPEVPLQGADPDITDAGRFQVPPLKQQLLNPPVKKQQQPLQQMNGIVKKGQQQQQQQRVVKKKVKKNMMNVKKQPPPPQMQQQQQQHIKSNGRQQVQQQQRQLEHPDPVVGVDKKQQQHANIHPNLAHPHVQQQQQQQQGKQNLHGEEHREHDQQQQQQQQQLQHHQAVMSDPLLTAHQLANNHPPEQQQQQQHGQQRQQQQAVVHPDDTKLDLQKQQQQQQQHRPLLDPAVVVVKAGGGGGAIPVKKANNNNSNRNGMNVVKKQPMNMVLAKPPDHVGGAVADLRRHI